MENDALRPILPKKMYDRIEEDIVNLYLDLGLTVPIRPYEIANQLHFIVKHFSEITNKEALNILISQNEEGKIRDGISYWNPSLSTFVIWVNDLDSSYQPRLNFTVMHEIGHIRMGHKCNSLLAETIGNYYAAYALVPSPLPDLLDCSSFIDISYTFDVSMQCAFNCANRISNWTMCGGVTKSYEKRLTRYYRKILGQGGGKMKL